MNQAQAKPIRRRRRWLIVASVLVLVSMVSWWYWPRVDSRLVGTWLWKGHANSTRVLGEWKFDDDGRFSGWNIFMASDPTGWNEPTKYWHAERDGFGIVPPSRTNGSPLQKLDDLWRQMCGLRTTHYKFIHFSETRLQIQQLVNGRLSGDIQTLERKPPH